jgi:hypothetical protein
VAANIGSHSGDELQNIPHEPMDPVKGMALSSGVLSTWLSDTETMNAGLYSTGNYDRIVEDKVKRMKYIIQDFRQHLDKVQLR